MPSTVSRSPRPPDGNSPQVTASTKISMRPCQKFGIDTPMIDVPMMNRAVAVSGRSPVYMPSGMPVASAMIMATNTSSTVAGMRWTTSSSAGSLNANERPKSPCTRFET